VHLFFGHGAKPSPAPRAIEKDIELQLVAKDKIDELILGSGEFVSVPVIGFYHFAKIKGLL
jgi:hypothetical protein